jgi:hypothetical protein
MTFGCADISSTPILQPALQRHSTENSKQIFPEKELRGLNPNVHIHVSVSDLYIPRIGLPILICGQNLGIYKSNHRHLNVEIGTDAAQFSFWEYINGIFVAVRHLSKL